MSAGLAGWLAAAGAGAFVLSVLCNAAARGIAPRIGFVDRPGGHKSHARVMPYGGGTAIFAASWLPLGVALLLAVLVPSEWVAATFGETVRELQGGVVLRGVPALVIFGGALALHVLGLVDDVRPLGPYPKLLVIVVVALLVATYGHVRLAEFAGKPVAIALTTAWLIVIINAFNFLDNMDGLSAGVALIGLAFLTVCGLLAGQVLVPLLAAVFVGAVSGFLVFNFPPAKLFMGDGGSLVLGYMLAVVSVRTTYYESGGDTPPYALAKPLVILAVPLYDFASVVLIRLREGRHPMRGDQRHFSHRLVERGLNRRMAVFTIYLATATTGLAATLLTDATLPTTLTVVAIVLMVLAIIAILEAPLRRDGA